MPWNPESPMDQKKQVIADYYRNVLTVEELAERYGVSRKTIYKWVDRFTQDGQRGLEERSCRPHHSPHQTPAAIVEKILQVQKRHRWGAKKLRRILMDRDPRVAWPSVATFTTILDRNGCVVKRRRRRKPGHPGKPSTSPDAPNLVWSADFKGQFKTRDGRYCYPLTVTDNYSRYLLGCQALRSTACASAKRVFVRLFREFGLPDRIRTDNGVPFATVSLGRMSSLSGWWIRLGVMPELIVPGKPQQNGRHERMHRTLKDATARPPAGNLRAQQRAFNRFREEFNKVRPHEALELRPPGAFYTPSPRPFPEKLPELEYPAHFEKRYVSFNGGMRWKSNWVCVSRICQGAHIGLEEVDNEVWDVYFGPLRIGRFYEQLMRIQDDAGRLFRHQKL